MSKHPSSVPFILAPLVPAVSMFLYAIFEPDPFGRGVDYLIEKAVISFLLYFIYAGIAFGCIGLPSLLIVRLVWKITWYIALIGGFVSGVLAYLIFFKFNTEYIADILTFGALGAVSGLAFWLASKKYGSTIIAF